MTLEAVLEQTNGANETPLPSPEEAAAHGYSPGRAHPLDLRSESRPGSHDAYMGMVRSMVDREMRTLGSYIQSGRYRHQRLRSVVTRLYHLALWQITSPAGLMNHQRTELIRERSSIQGMLKPFNLPLDPEDVRKLDDGQREELYQTSLFYGEETLRQFTSSAWLIPLDCRDAYDRLDEISARVRNLTVQIQEAQRSGHYWDGGPLIEYFRTPYKDRGDIDLMAIAPPFLLKLQAYIDVSISETWRHQAQRITSQTADGDEASQSESEGEPGNKKRSLFGRIRGK